MIANFDIGMRKSQTLCVNSNTVYRPTACSGGKTENLGATSHGILFYHLFADMLIKSQENLRGSLAGYKPDSVCLQATVI